MTKTNYGFKKRIIRDLLKRDPSRTDYEVASLVGCHRTYVGTQRRDLAASTTREEEYQYPLRLTMDMVCAEPVSETLDERHKTYGIFEDLSKVAVDIKAAVRERLRDEPSKLAPDQQEALDMIATKIARIVNGDPNKVDHWTDIAGYATLVAERLGGERR